MKAKQQAALHQSSGSCGLLSPNQNTEKHRLLPGEPNTAALMEDSNSLEIWPKGSGNRMSK